MKEFSYEVALNQLAVGKDVRLNEIQYGKIPSWVQGHNFLDLFLPYVKIIGDSREQNRWIERACQYYGIAFEWAKKDKKAKTENLKEGDYTFAVIFGAKTYDYTGQVAYERKGSVSELYNNCIGNKEHNDRERIKREFNRFGAKGYRKIVLLLEVGNTLTDLINAQFTFYGRDGAVHTKSTNYTIYSALMSWKQPNNADFDIIQSDSHERLFWSMLQDCYYFFRNDIRIECEDKKLIGEEKC